MVEEEEREREQKEWQGKQTKKPALEQGQELELEQKEGVEQALDQLASEFRQHHWFDWCFWSQNFGLLIRRPRSLENHLRID